MKMQYLENLSERDTTEETNALNVNLLVVKS